MKKSKTDDRERIRLVGPKDLEFSYFCGSGAGGQARNKVHSGVQVRHPESGATGRASDSRSQDQNKRSAFERMVATPQMKFWLAKRLYEIRQEETMQETVERDTSGKNCKYEIKNASGQWEEVNEEYFNTQAAKEE